MLYSVSPTTRLGVSFANGEDCGVPAHKTNPTSTHPNGRFFEHLHMEINLPQTLMKPSANPNGSPETITLTSDMIQSYWDYRYITANSSDPPCTGGSGVTCNYNCWGYAFGYDCWVQNPEYIYADNYDPAPGNPTSIPQGEMVTKLSGHAQKLTGVSLSFPVPGHAIYLKKETVEKNRESGIYTQSWGGAGTLVYSIYIKK